MQPKPESVWLPLLTEGLPKPPKRWRPENGMREQTIAYYKLEGLPRELIRSTWLEDAHPLAELGRKFRQVCCFGSLKGARVASYLQVQRLNTAWAGQTWWQVSHALYLDFLTLDP